jgi:hypothetical integral membrane protein (TIGR02206 family)
MDSHWHSHFDSYSPLHGVTVLFFALVWALLIAIGLSARGRAWAASWRGVLGGAALLAWAWANLVQLLPAHFVAADNLPIQICDFAGLLVPFALWTRNRYVQAAVYFWGGTFSVLAILTPDLRSGVAMIGFWTFWIPHANLTGAAFYTVIVDGFRPQWSDCWRIYAVTVLYLLLILSFDLLTGFNYGYVGPDTPLQPPIIEHLGPWPWRVVVMTLLAALAFVLLQLPWQKHAARRPARLEVGRSQ